MDDLQAHVDDPARLRALHSVALLDSPAEEAFDRLSRLAARLLEAPVSLVSLVDADRQFFKSCIGLEAEPWKSKRETPLSHSFCQHNRVAGQPLVIEDARTHPLVKDNLAITDLDVVAYLGFPLATPDGYILGSFCVIDSKPRSWAKEDVDTLRDLAGAVMVEIQLRSEIATRHQVEGERDELNQLNEQLVAEISARRDAEEQQQQLEAQLSRSRKIETVGQLAGGVAHDLNNLLAPILIYTSALIDENGLSERHSEIVGKIQETGLRAREVIRELLTFSRMQTDEFAVLNANQVISDMESLFSRTIPEDITMAIELESDLPNVLADRSQFERVLMNLVVNACDAMPSGGPLTIETSRVTLDTQAVQANPEATAGEFVRLAVRDAGVGMDGATSRQLFDPFFTTKGSAGTGLGLATVLGVALQHGGLVGCESVLGEGTEVCFFLPTTDELAAAVERHDVLAGSATRTDTILVAEDDATVRESIVRVLTANGFTVLSATDGEDALTQLTYFDKPIHLLLTDVVMPNMNGRGLFQEAVKMRPGLKVLYMSGYNDDVMSHRGRLDPGSHFIAKPFLRDELLAQIDRALQSPAPASSSSNSSGERQNPAAL